MKAVAEILSLSEQWFEMLKKNQTLAKKWLNTFLEQTRDTGVNSESRILLIQL